ncbi:hypothetical protein JTB14_024246 [Gonioctena quinquepunctata]|nr:hypothetical protein JTB14_024246 [Gonioctena quinquepunctata]
MANLAFASLFLSMFALAESMKRSSTYFKKSGGEDLETSASGYSYQLKSTKPFGYSSFGESEDKLDQFPSINLGRYSDQPLPLNLLPLSPKHLSEYNSDLDSNSDGLFPYAKGFENFVDDPNKINSNLNNYVSQSTNFIKGGGSNYEDAEKTSRGEKGEQGYSDRDEFAKGLTGRHDNEQKKDSYDVSAGNKRAHQEQDGHYASRHQSGEGSKGGSFSNEGSHEKGSKTTGYHKVFHKDEYKKDHSFYDKADKKGHFNRHGNFDTKAAAEAGAFAKGKNLEAGFKEGKFGAKGLREKGHYLDESKGYKGAKGDEKYYKNGDAYANRAGKSSGVVGGFSEGDKYGEYAEEK